MNEELKKQCFEAYNNYYHKCAADMGYDNWQTAWMQGRKGVAAPDFVSAPTETTFQRSIDDDGHFSELLGALHPASIQAIIAFVDENMVPRTAALMQPVSDTLSPTLICKKCRVDRAKDPCPRHEDYCGLNVRAQCRN